MNSDELISSAKHLYDEGSEKLNQVKSQIISLMPFWVAGSITAIVASLYAKLFAAVESLSINILKTTNYWFLVISPIFFFISWYIVEKVAPFSNGSGIPQLMAAAELTREKKENTFGDLLLGYRVILSKLVSSLVGVLGGGAIGREGPTLQISGSIFYLLNKKIFKMEEARGRYGFILAGAASGLASAFNTPLGGIVYVVEELAKSHLSGFRTGVLHSVIFAGIISQMIMGSYLYFGYPKTGALLFNQYGYVIILSIFSGLVVTLFAQSLKYISTYRSKLTKFKSKLFFTLLCGFAFAATVLFVSDKGMGPGKELLENILFKNSTAKIEEVFARFFGTILTYSAGGAGGIFAPTLSLGGACASYLTSILGTDLGPIATLIGMSAGLSALTHSPLTTFILILEMTDRHSAIFPIMIASVIGHGVSRLIAKKSFYEFIFDRILNQFSVKVDHEAHHS